MATTPQITEDVYQRLVFSDPDRQWELHEGQLQEKPGNTWEHGLVKSELSHLLMSQLDHAEYLAFSAARVRTWPATIYMPDLMVVPTVYGQEFRGRPDALAIFSDPLPLVVEIWNAIDGYDVDAKLPRYQQRGDLEIWRIHPYEKTLISWRRQPDGTYDELAFWEGDVTLIALPWVTINLTKLFAA
jgi:Uma2 family endonuclease